MQEVERQLAAASPTAKRPHFTHIVDTQEIDQDPDNFPNLKAACHTAWTVSWRGPD